MTPLTFEQAKQLVPEYIMLKTGIDKWREGDEVHIAHGWQTCKEEAGTLVHWPRSRRPIPYKVRDAMAMGIMLHGKYLNDPFTSWLLEQSQ
jgi:hypothetical protein